MRGRVLIIDDNVEYLDSTADVLELEGFDVATASSGDDGIELARQKGFDVVLIDHRMPGRSGVECIAQIKQLLPEAQVVMVTAYGSDEVVSAAFKEGALAVLSKPLNLEDLSGLLQEHHPAGEAQCLLVVDDDIEFCASLRDVLEQRGYQADCAQDGDTAASKVSAQPYDLVLLDMHLRDEDGLEIYRRLKKLQPGIACVVLSGHIEDMDDEIQQTLRESAYTCLSKPPDLGRLVRLVGELCDTAAGRGPEGCSG